MDRSKFSICPFVLSGGGTVSLEVGDTVGGWKQGSEGRHLSDPHWDDQIKTKQPGQGCTDSRK